MVVADRQQLGLASSDPEFPLQSAAFRTVSVAAGVVADADRAALGTAVEVATQCIGPLIVQTGLQIKNCNFEYGKA